MATFDIIEAANYGYRHAWRERRYLARLAAVPLLVNFICVSAIEGLGWNDMLLRQAVVLLPASFANGWMLSHYVRLLFLDQRWPFRPAGNPVLDQPALQDRMHGILAGTLMFTLSQVVLYGFADLLFFLQPDPALKTPPPSANVIAFLCVGVTSIWAFRFLWFYIPAALRYDLSRCKTEIKGGGTSFYMFGTMLICFLPVQMPMVLFALFLNAQFGAKSLPWPVESVRILAGLMTDIAVYMVVTGAMSFAFRAMIAGAKPGRR